MNPEPTFFDDQCINVTDPLQLHSWAKALGATREEIRVALAEVGPSLIG